MVRSGSADGAQAISCSRREQCKHCARYVQHQTLLILGLPKGQACQSLRPSREVGGHRADGSEF